MKKRSVISLVAGGLLAAMLPGVAAAQGSASANVATLSALVSDYVWDGRLAGDLPREYIWDRRLTSGPSPDYVWDNRLASSPTWVSTLSS